MCQSAEVSFGTWAFGMISAVILSMRGRIPVFPLVVTQMQLIEGLRWIHALDERILAVLGKIALQAQPAAGLWEAGAKSYILPQVLVQLGVELLFGSRDLRFVVAEDGHFRWKWLESPEITQVPQWIGLTQSAYRLFPVWLNTLLIGLQAYQIQHHRKYHTDGSLWCVSVNLMWIWQLLK